MRVLFYLIILMAYHATAQEFYAPAAGTYYEGDSLMVRLRANPFPAHSGKSWGLVLIHDPGTAKEKRFVLLDTVRLKADSTFEHGITALPAPHPDVSKYALALEYRPALTLYYSAAFTLMRRPTAARRLAPAPGSSWPSRSYWTLTGRRIDERHGGPYAKP